MTFQPALNKTPPERSDWGLPLLGFLFAAQKANNMKNRIDTLIDRTRDAILTNDGSPDTQQIINKEILIVLEEINKILRTCERDLR